MMATREAAEAASISYRQADYWARAGFVSKHLMDLGTGNSRYWTPEDVDRLILLRAARDDVTRAKAAWRNLTESSPEVDSSESSV